MQWNRSSAIGLALASCTHCDGHGMRQLRRGAVEEPCRCVFRAVFRTCYTYFREYAAASEQPGTVSLEFNQGPVGYRMYSMKRAEFAADFCLAARRVLSELEHKVFRYTFLLGADWKLCCRYLGVDRGYYYHLVYRVEEKLGRYFAEVEPDPLYPLDEYLGGTVRTSRMRIQAVPYRMKMRKQERLPMTA